MTNSRMLTIYAFFVVLLMPSDRLFDMEQFSLLNVPLSSARSSLAPDPTASPNRSLTSTYMQHHLSPASHAERTSGLLKANGSEADLASVYSDSVEDEKDLREKFDVVVREKDEALRLLAEAGKVMYLVGAAG